MRLSKGAVCFGSVGSGGVVCCADNPGLFNAGLRFPRVFLSACIVANMNLR